MTHFLAPIKRQAQKHWPWWCLYAGAAILLGMAGAWFGSQYLFAGLIALACTIVIAFNPVAGMYLLTFFLPFERIGSIDLMGVTIRISQVVAILTIATWCVRGLWLGSFKFRPYPLLMPLAGFVAVASLAVTNAPNLERSVLVTIFILFTIGVSVILPSIIRHTNQVEKLVTILLISMAVVCLFGIYQFLGDIVGLPTSLTGLRPQYTKDILGFPRIQSTAPEPLYFANYLLLPLSITVGLWLSRTSRFKPVWLLLLVLLGGVNFILTVSRGGYIALAATLGILALVYIKQLLRPRILIPIVLCLAVAGGVAYRFLNLTEQLETYTTHVTNIFGGASYEERVETYTIAERIWLQHPWIGIGPGSFGPYAANHPLITPSEGYKIVNNEYIELLAETGILGLICILVMVVMLYVRSWKAIRKTTNPFLRAVLIALLAAMTGILVQYNTFSVLYIMHIWFTIGLMVSIQNIILHGDYQ
ncbi:MAG: O-antigen ligase family protein [Candidatus Kerfeldbacteria bacterium]|nr:O-antigen ligase family protein [Candidatus Kerfeldbacteria bacterium]